MNKIYLASYPASGSHWLAYIINNLTSIPIFEYSKQLKNIYAGTNKKFQINKGHVSGDIHKKEIDNSEGLILIIRNYKESIIRRLKQHNSFSLGNLTQGTIVNFVIDNLKNKKFNENDIYGHSIDYMRLLDIYHNFKGLKHHIYYEDLITNTEKEVSKLCEYFKKLNLTISTNDFLHNLEEHKKASLKSYPKIVPGTKTLTNGNSKISHSLSLTDESKIQIDIFIKENFNDLFERYLKRYDENIIN